MGPLVPPQPLYEILPSLSANQAPRPDLQQLQPSVPLPGPAVVSSQDALSRPAILAGPPGPPGRPGPPGPPGPPSNPALMPRAGPTRHLIDAAQCIIQDGNPDLLLLIL